MFLQSSGKWCYNFDLTNWKALGAYLPFKLKFINGDLFRWQHLKNISDLLLSNYSAFEYNAIANSSCIALKSSLWNVWIRSSLSYYFAIQINVLLLKCWYNDPQVCWQNGTIFIIFVSERLLMVVVPIFLKFPFWDT